MKCFEKTKDIFPSFMLSKVIVCIGCGGARSFLENLARCGFLNFVLIDGDLICETNIGTQSVFLHEIGMQKTEAIRQHIIDINPEVNVICVNRFIDDSFSDEEFESILMRFGLNSSRCGTDFLICGCTDNFRGQTRASYLGLKFGIPYIAAMLYERGLGAEIFFMYPGVTPCCPRCVWRSRYEQYEHGFKSTVTSAGTPIFATERMNALKGYISLALLGYSEEDDSNPFSNILMQIKDRSLVQIRLTPDITSLGITLFDEISDKTHTCFDDTIFVPVWVDSAENGEDCCKLCGGTGDLRTLINKWADTRKINKF